MPGTDNGIGLAMLDQIDRAAHRGIFFPPHRFHRTIAHFDYLRGVDNLYPRIVAAQFLEFGFYLPGIADEKKSSDTAIFAQSKNGSANQIGWTKVAPHRIQRDFHAR